MFSLFPCTISMQSYFKAGLIGDAIGLRIVHCKYKHVRFLSKLKLVAHVKIGGGKKSREMSCRRSITELRQIRSSVSVKYSVRSD